MPRSTCRCGWCRRTGATRGYAGLVNAVLRRVAQNGAQQLRGKDTVALDTPDWLMARWQRAYGAELAHAIAAANGQEPALDITVKSDPAHWAEALGGQVLPTGSVRADRARAGAAAAGLRRRRMVGAGRRGGACPRSCSATCAANRSPISARRRAARPRSLRPPARASPRSTARRHGSSDLKQNLARLGLAADTVTADVTEWQSEPFDAVLLDAPCSATGTIRRHPDIPWLKRESDIAALAALQRRLLARAVELTRPGGLHRLLHLFAGAGRGRGAGDRAAGARFARAPPPGCGGRGSGPSRTSSTPPATCARCPANCLIPDPQMGGLDGFYACRIERV